MTFAEKKWASTLLNADIKPYVQFEASFINLELLELQANVTEIKQSTCNKGISIVCAVKSFFFFLCRELKLAPWREAASAKQILQTSVILQEPANMMFLFTLEKMGQK